MNTSIMAKCGETLRFELEYKICIEYLLSVPTKHGLVTETRLGTISSMTMGKGIIHEMTFFVAQNWAGYLRKKAKCLCMTSSGHIN